jgi:hypothetical protein
MSDTATLRGTCFTNIIGFENNGDFGTDRERVLLVGLGRIDSSTTRCLGSTGGMTFGLEPTKRKDDFPFSPTKRIFFSLLSSPAHKMRLGR